MEEPEQDTGASPGSSCDNDKDEKRELQEEINSLKSQQKSIKCENHNLMSKLQEAEIINQSLQEQVQVLNRNNQSLTEQKDDLILRLSKLTVDNSNIADLSDSKRPTKLAEEFAELYDNEWTDAFENIHLESEQEKIAFMLRLLQSARQICNDVSRRHIEDMKKGIFTLTVDTKTSSEKLSSEQNAIRSCDKSEKAECECHESEDKRKRLIVDAFDSVPLEEYEMHVIADDVSTFSAAQKQAILEIKRNVEVRLSKQLQKVGCLHLFTVAVSFFLKEVCRTETCKTKTCRTELF
ncbi:uncharacterized protein LOC132757628 [Ruditapes philippinarum]|uniref:uncharacterized protein LOC132757628 n=1 Tax=Ruditapes philippinarum TaxID=129788 RepID=UPI00295A5EB6|nr:uncharacterized protein LOC132757628 [Ruditapes philippinarum]